MPKRLMVLAGMLVVVLVVAVPALAQEGATESETAAGLQQPAQETSTEGGEAADAPSSGETPVRYVTFTFELAVEGEPPEGAVFAGQLIGEGATYTPLTDPDGDGTYTGSERLPFGPFAPGVDVEEALEAIRPYVAIVQGVETAEGFVPSNLIEDFGLQRLDEDKTFRSSIAFDGSGDPPFRPVYTAVGVLEESGLETRDPTPTYSITDEETGASYELQSVFVDLEPYVGERVLIYGVPIPGLPGPGGVPRGLNVTEVYPLGDSGETVTVTFELAVDGEVPENRTLAMRLRSGSPARFYEGPAGEVTFCATNGNPNLPACEDGGTYSGTLEVPAGEPIAFDYVDLGDGGETFYSDTRTFAEDDTVRVTYDANAGSGTDDGDGDGGGTTTPGTTDGSSNSSGSDNGDSPGSGSGDSGSGSGSADSGSSGSGGGFLNGFASGVRDLLPSTGGGVSLAVLVVGVLLVAGGLLVRKIFR